MDEIMLLETIERYLSGEMTQQEQILFENLRKSNPEIDQTVVEHTYFLHGLEKFGAAKSFKNTLHEVEAKLVDEGIIAQPKLKGKAKVVYLWGRYKRNMAVAASIAGFISLITLGLMVPLTKKYSNENIQTLVKELNKTKSDVERLKSRSTTSQRCGSSSSCGRRYPPTSCTTKRLICCNFSVTPACKHHSCSICFGKSQPTV